MPISILLEDVKNIIEMAAIIAGGIWAVYRFGLFREKFPSMEISNGINYIGENSEENLIELYCIVENKGKVRKWIAPFDFKLKSLSTSDEFVRGEEISWQIKLKDLETSKGEYIQRRYWVSPDWHLPFVDGQSKRRFQYLTAVPKSVSYLSLYTRFIDFNNKKEAVDYIMYKSEDIDKELINKTFEDRVKYVKDKKSDFYYTRITVSIESIKNNNTKQSSSESVTK